MTQGEKDEYRKAVAEQLKEKVSEIDTNISYVIIGSLGFFLTINEKFIGFKEASCIWLAYLSIIFLLSSFFLFLYNKHLTTKYDREIIDFVDGMNINNREDDVKLLEMWKKSDSSVTSFRNINYFLVSIGITFEIIFFMINVENHNKKGTESNLRNYTYIKDSSNSPLINIENNPIFLNNNNCKSDSILKEVNKCHHKPCK